jgi:hypothetical protein
MAVGDVSESAGSDAVAGASAGPLRGSAASGTSAKNVDGDAVALTVLSAMRQWGLLELPVFFFFIRRGRKSLTDLKKLSFIQAARWSIIRRLPANGSYPETRLRFPLLYFESNFNGGWEEYIDAFSYTLTTGMFGFWGSSYGFPGALPASEFKEYIRRNEYEAGHYYSAYPDATATTVLAALELSPKVAALRAAAEQMTAEQFAQAWSEFLRDEQGSL